MIVDNEVKEGQSGRVFLSSSIFLHSSDVGVAVRRTVSVVFQRDGLFGGGTSWISAMLISLFI